MQSEELEKKIGRKWSKLDRKMEVIGRNGPKLEEN